MKRVAHEGMEAQSGDGEGSIAGCFSCSFPLQANVNVFPQVLYYLASIKDPKFQSNIKTLTSVLYHKQRRESAGLELDPTQFQLMIEDANPQLKGFFPSMVNAIIPKDRSAHNKKEAKKTVVALCYMIAGQRNKFVNQLKVEVGLYLAASGATWEAIDTMSSLGYSSCAKTIADVQKRIQVEHVGKIKQHLTEKVFYLKNGEMVPSRL